MDTLIADLQGLVHALEGEDVAWKNAFLEDWADLEQDRAIALFRGAQKLSPQEAKVVSDAVGRLKLHVLEKIDDRLDRGVAQAGHFFR